MGKKAGLVTTAEVAARANVSTRTVARWVDTGKLTVAYKVPGRTGPMLFASAEVDALIANEIKRLADEVAALIANESGAA